MKIAYVIANFPVASETFVANEIERLVRRGHDISIFAFAGPSLAEAAKLGATAQRLRDRITYISVGEACLAAIRNPVKVLRGLFVNRALHRASTRKSNPLLMLLRAVALAERFDEAGICHVHAHWPYASQIAHLVRSIAGTTYSVSVHAHEVAHENGHFPVIFPGLSFAAFCNRAAMEYLLPHVAERERDRAHLIYHGVDVARFEQLPLPQGIRPIRLISAGRLTKTKGFDRLIGACAAARARGLDVQLTILGQGAMQEQLHALAHELGFGSYLTMPGWVPHEEVRNYMQAAHLFVLMADTSFHDGLPNVVLEAMACGRPVVLTRLPAAREAIEDGVEGFLLDDVADTDGLIAILERLQSDPSRLEAMGRAARRRVEADHDAELQIARMAQLLGHHARVASAAEAAS